MIKTVMVIVSVRRSMMIAVSVQRVTVVIPQTVIRIVMRIVLVQRLRMSAAYVLVVYQVT